MNLLEQQKEQLFELCGKFHVQSLYLFGSALTNEFTPKSDIDILVQFADVELSEYFDNYMDFKESLEILFEREIDLVEDQAIKNPIFRKSVDNQKMLIYERVSA